jgi:hypothetical protein
MGECLGTITQEKKIGSFIGVCSVKMEYCNLPSVSLNLWSKF